MTRENIMEAMNGIGEHLIVEAAEKLGFLSGSAAMTKGRKAKEQSAFSRFMNSGWGVAAVCALVAVSVMSGIIWAGHQAGVKPPIAATEEPDTVVNAVESEGESMDQTVETEIEIQTPTFDFMTSLSAIDQLASENFSVSLKYQTKTYDGLSHEFSGGLGQVNGKYWYRVDMDGTAILEEEGGYYHKYTFESSKWRYYDTYEMTAKEEFDKVFNGRYWWKNYLDELTFEAYDELTYTGVGQVSEQDCHIFYFEGTVTDGSQAKLTLYVDAESSNVTKMEAELLSSTHNHLSTDARQATIEISNIKTGDDAIGPTLPDPKWNGPQDDGPIEIETPPVTEPPEETETGKAEPPTVIPELDDLMAAPLVSAMDSESYVRIPYLSRGMGGVMEFFILPEGAQDASELVSVYQIGFPEDHETNLLVVGVEKSANEYGVLFIMETSYVTELNGEEIRYVGMTCTEMVFFRDKSFSTTGNTYFLMQNGGAASFQYTDQQRGSILASKRRENLNALAKAEELIESYRNATDNKYTVIYSYSDQSAEELAMAHIPELPEISFEIFREYGFDD